MILACALEVLPRAYDDLRLLDNAGADQMDAASLLIFIDVPDLYGADLLRAVGKVQLADKLASSTLWHQCLPRPSHSKSLSWRPSICHRRAARLSRLRAIFVAQGSPTGFVKVVQGPQPAWVPLERALMLQLWKWSETHEGCLVLEQGHKPVKL